MQFSVLPSRPHHCFCTPGVLSPFLGSLVSSKIPMVCGPQVLGGDEVLEPVAEPILIPAVLAVKPYSRRFHLDVADGDYVTNLLLLPRFGGGVSQAYPPPLRGPPDDDGPVDLDQALLGCRGRRFHLLPGLGGRSSSGHSGDQGCGQVRRSLAADRGGPRAARPRTGATWTS